MPLIPPRCWPRFGFYGVLLSLAWVIGGSLAVAVINFAVSVVVLDTLAEFLWWATRFAPRKKVSLGVWAAEGAVAKFVRGEDSSAAVRSP